MKIKIDLKYNVCLEKNCVFQKECAQHDSAGDFRCESGFTPELRKINNDIYCDTINQTAIFTPFQIIPENYKDLGFGMVGFNNVYEEEVFEI